MPITELENNSESICVKVFANEISHFVASWYWPPGGTSEEFQLFREQLDYIRTHHKGEKLPSVHVLGDLNFKDIDWPDRFSKSGSTLSQSEWQISYMWTLPDHPGASRKWSPNPALPWVRQNLPDVKKNFFFFFFLIIFQTIIFAHMYGNISHLLL